MNYVCCLDVLLIYIAWISFTRVLLCVFLPTASKNAYISYFDIYFNRFCINYCWEVFFPEQISCNSYICVCVFCVINLLQLESIVFGCSGILHNIGFIFIESYDEWIPVPKA